MTTPTERIRALNDELRQSLSTVYGKVMITQGFKALDTSVQLRLLRAITQFEAFTPDNDPHDEHDCAIIKEDGTSVIFKIDYYDRSERIHSPDPADASVTVRVMTIMLVEEW